MGEQNGTPVVLGDVCLVERAVICHEDAHQVANFHAQFVIGEKRA